MIKIIETIRGAGENTLIYEDEAGNRKAVTRPNIVSIEQIIEEIESGSKKNAKKPAETKVRETVPENTPNVAPSGAPDAAEPEQGVNTQNSEQGAKTGRK